MTTLDKSKSKEEIRTWHLWVIFLIAGLAVLAVLLFYHHYFGSITSDNNKWGTFGDYIGGTLNPILSFLALIALLYTIHIQSRELRLSRDELELTRTELKKTGDAAQKQVAHFEREERRADTYRLIEKLASRINKNIESNRLPHNSSLYGLIYESASGREGITFKREGMDKIKEWHDKNDRSTNNLISWLSTDLLRLKEYLDQYEEISAQDIDYKDQTQKEGGSDFVTPLPDFYISEFSNVTHMLFEYDMLRSDIHEYYCANCKNISHDDSVFSL